MEPMLDLIMSVILAAAFLYVVLLMTSPRGSWNCPICRFLSRLAGGSKAPLPGRSEQ